MCDSRPPGSDTPQKNHRSPGTPRSEAYPGDPTVPTRDSPWKLNWVWLKNFIFWGVNSLDFRKLNSDSKT